MASCFLGSPGQTYSIDEGMWVTAVGHEKVDCLDDLLRVEKKLVGAEAESTRVMLRDEHGVEHARPLRFDRTFWPCVALRRNPERRWSRFEYADGFGLPSTSG